MLTEVVHGVGLSQHESGVHARVSSQERFVLLQQTIEVRTAPPRITRQLWPGVQKYTIREVWNSEDRALPVQSQQQVRLLVVVKRLVETTDGHENFPFHDQRVLGPEGQPGIDLLQPEMRATGEGRRKMSLKDATVFIHDFQA
jgi:hypothetical protein